ncbi:hypothetical protein CLOM_g23785 [Closterium sp. NIES-68]|nr:hypothetical protein CLOM_g23785 [Closterium sp. NIES-68]GJP66857.1 hypothetical protein CLOP_g23743 [Closterium sp. NIES-67]
MAPARELMLMAVVAFLLANVATAFTTATCIKEAEQLVKVLDAKPATPYSFISRELKKLIKAVKAGYDVGEFYDSTLLIPTNHALAVAKINPSKIRYKEDFYRTHILDGQVDDITSTAGEKQLTSNPGVSVRIFKAPTFPLGVVLRVAGTKNRPSAVLEHLHTGTENCFEAYGINRVLVK